MKILVTGAAGFIGSHLVELLFAEGEDVRCFAKPGSDISSVANLTTDIGYGDLIDIEAIKEATKGIDVVYHLGALAKYNVNDPSIDYERVNMGGTKNVLEACRANRVKKVVYTSSLEAVGLSIDGKPLNEDSEPRPRNIYGESKLGGERVCKEYFEKYGMDVVIVRFPMVYGPRNLLHLKRLFGMVKKKYYPIVGDGSALMEFCYVKNAVSGLKAAMEKGKAGEIYFISDERSYQFREVLTAIAKQLDVDLKLIKMPIFIANGIGFSFEFLSKFLKFYPFTFKATGRPAFSRATVSWMAKSTLFCDVSKAKTELGYKPKYVLEDGVMETIDWHRKIGVL